MVDDITRLVEAANCGNADARRELFAQVYAELKRLAHRQLRGSANPTLGTTVLVHDTYLKLAGPDVQPVASRRHFFALAARAMRQIIIDHARARVAAKRGGAEVRHVPLDELRDVANSQIAPDQLLQLDAALGELEKDAPHLTELIELRCFVGLPLQEIAEMQGVAERTLYRDWRRARARLYAAIYP